MLSYEERLAKNISKSETDNVLKKFYGIVSGATTKKDDRWVNHWVLDLAAALCHEFGDEFAVKLAQTIINAAGMTRLQEQYYDIDLSSIEAYFGRHRQ